MPSVVQRTASRITSDADSAPKTPRQPATVTTSEAAQRASTLSHQGRILVVCSELATVRAFHALLQGQGHAVQCASTCAAAARILPDLRPEIIITDWLLPDQREAGLCEYLRRRSSAAIIVVNAVDDEALCAAALGAGADDVVSPSRAKELVARVTALVHRLKGRRDEVLAAGDITIDLQTRDVTVGTRVVRLRPHEFDLLVHFARHPSVVLPYRALLAAVWGPSVQLRPHYVRMCVAHLRRQIEPTPSQPQYLLTERFIGYRLEPHASRVSRVKDCA